MSLNLRIFLAYFLIVGVALYLLLDVFMSELKPGMRQSTEDTLVDMSNLLAEVVTQEFVANPEDLTYFSQNMNRFLDRFHKAKISSIDKQASNIRIYITDSLGIVRYDSSSLDVGKDYSLWNDVYLTLRGKYGARSTKSDPNNEFSTVMHVAAPIMHNGQIVGVLTVAKPNLSVQPFLDLARENVKNQGVWLIALSLIAALTLSFWLTHSIRKLVQYASKISQGKSTPLPKVRETELAKLATAMDKMRRELEGKDYVEKYIYALTHELKSPVSAIKGASEILVPKMPEKTQAKFIGNIQHEVERIDEMINRLLKLATVEKQEKLESIESFDLVETIDQVIRSKQTQLTKRALVINSSFSTSAYYNGDHFLIMQAIDNLIQNAIDFSPVNGTITISISQSETVNITVIDQGCGIPDYALNRVFERFYSLSRPSSDKKSSGLGLCFVKQIAELHHGNVSVQNNVGKGVKASLFLSNISY